MTSAPETGTKPETPILDSRLRGNDGSGRAICGCLLDCPAGDFAAWLRHPGIDMLEWRMDHFGAKFAQSDPQTWYAAMSEKDRHPVIATNRPPRELGNFEGPEDVRLEMLEAAARAGAEWVDLELDAASENITRFRKLGAKVLVSNHNPAGTPSKKELVALLERMARTGADALKIVTLAKTGEEVLSVLELIPAARHDFGADLVAFCMGPAASWSRVACLLVGSPWTYATLPAQGEAAPGQLSAAEIRSALKILDRM